MILTVYLSLFPSLLGKSHILEELSLILAPTIDKIEFNKQIENSRVVRKDVCTVYKIWKIYSSDIFC